MLTKSQPKTNSTAQSGKKKTERPPANELNFGPQAELEEDERKWRAAFDATTPEQLSKLEQMFAEDEQEGTFPLNFSGR